jgi:hypothetical protein
MINDRLKRLAVLLVSGIKSGFMNDSHHQYGDCGIEVYGVVKRLLNQGVFRFKVIEGKVYLNGNYDNPVDHTWIEMNGNIIDPTESQFKGAHVDYRPVTGEFREEYTPQRYIKNFEGQYGDLL